MRLFGLTVCTALTLACAGSRAATDGDPVASPRLEARRGELVERVLLTGELVAEDAVLLVAPNVNVWPLQIRWLAEDGAEVKAGESVVELDNSRVVTNLEERRAGVVEAVNRLAGAEAQAAGAGAEARFEMERRRAAFEKARIEAAVPRGLLPEVEYESKQLELEKAQLQLVEAEAKLASGRDSSRAQIEIERLALVKARRGIERSEEAVERLSLRAPRDGILILDDNRREGRRYHSGDTIYPGRTVARLPDLATLMVRAQLFDVDDGLLAPGMAVVATLDAFPDRAFTGRVREIDPVAMEASFRSLRRTFRVAIALDEVDPELMRPGMSVKVVAERRHDDLLLVPRASLDGIDSEPRVLLAGGDWRPVTLGPCNAILCAVREGLEASTPLGRVATRGVTGGAP